MAVCLKWENVMWIFGESLEWCDEDVLDETEAPGIGLMKKAVIDHYKRGFCHLFAVGK